MNTSLLGWVHIGIAISGNMKQIKKGDKNIFGKNKIVKKCFIDIYLTFFVVKN